MVRLVIGVRNNTTEAAELLMCGFRLQRERANAFGTVYGGACTEPEARRIEARAAVTLPFSFQIDIQQLDTASLYRVSLPVSVAPDFRLSEPVFSDRFSFR